MQDLHQLLSIVDVAFKNKMSIVCIWFTTRELYWLTIKQTDAHILSALFSPVYSFQKLTIPAGAHIPVFSFLLFPFLVCSNPSVLLVWLRIKSSYSNAVQVLNEVNISALPTAVDFSFKKQAQKCLIHHPLSLLSSNIISPLCCLELRRCVQQYCSFRVNQHYPDQLTGLTWLLWERAEGQSH